MASIALYFLLPLSFLWGRFSFVLGLVIPSLVIFIDKSSSDYYNYYRIYQEACSLDFGSRLYELGYPLSSFFSCLFLGKSILAFDLFNSLLYLFIAFLFVRKSLALQRIAFPDHRNFFSSSSLILFIPLFLSIIQINWNFRGGFSAFIAYLSIIDFFLYKVSGRFIYIASGIGFAVLSIAFHIQSLPLIVVFGISQGFNFIIKNISFFPRFRMIKLRKTFLILPGLLSIVYLYLIRSSMLDVGAYKIFKYQSSNSGLNSSRFSLALWIFVAFFLLFFCTLKNKSFSRLCLRKRLDGLPAFIVASSLYVLFVNICFMGNSFLSARLSKSFEPEMLLWLIVFLSYRHFRLLPLFALTITAFYSYSFVLVRLL